MISNFVADGKKRVKKYNERYRDFVHARSASRAIFSPEAVDDVKPVGSIHKHQKLVKILNQNEGLSNEKLAATIIRQIYTVTSPGLTFPNPDQHPNQHLDDTPLLFDTLDTIEFAKSPTTPDELPAMTPGHFTTSRSSPRDDVISPDTRLLPPKMDYLKVMQRRRGEALQSMTPPVRNHFHY